MIMYFVFTNNISNYSEASVDSLYHNSLIITNSLISAGIPHNWNSTNIIEMGLTKESWIR